MANPVLRSVVRSGGARLAVLPLSAVLGIIATRLIVDNYGTAAYAQYTLLVGIISVLPFADLGMAAAIMNAVGASDDPAHDPDVHRVLVTSLRVLASSAVVFVLIALLLLGTGWWPALLGDGLLPDTGPLVATVCLVVIGLSITVGFGQRVLSGLGRNHVPVLLLGLQTPVVLVVLLIATTLDLPIGAWLAVIAYLVTFAISAVTCASAARLISPAVGRAVRSAPKLRRERGGPVFATAWPTLVQLVALPIAMQTDRIVLSHVASLRELAEYSLASQMFTPVGAVVAAAGVALWPVFARARVKGTPTVSPHALAWSFGAAAVVVCVLIALASPWLARVASGGQISLGVGVVVAFSVLMIGNALKNPYGNYMTNPAGLRFQALLIVACVLPVNLVLSIWLGREFGAPGPVVASALTVIAFQWIPNGWWVRRDLRRRVTAPPAPPAAPVEVQEV